MAIRLLKSVLGQAAGTILRDLPNAVERYIASQTWGSYDLDGGTEQTSPTVPSGAADSDLRAFLEFQALCNQNAVLVDAYPLWVQSGGVVIPVNAKKSNVWQGYRCLLLGDSHLHRSFSPVNLSAMVSDGETVSCTTSATHYLEVGNRITLYCNSTGASQGIYDGITVTISGAVDKTHFTFDAKQPTFKFNAKTWTSVPTGGWSYNDVKRIQDYGFWGWLNIALGCPFVCVGAYCLGGTTSSRWIPILDNLTYGQEVDYVFVSTGYNDMAAGATAAATLANIQTIITAIKATGATPIIITPPPFNSNASGYTVQRSVEFANLRHALLDLGVRDSGTIIVDLYGATVDSGSSTANYKSGYADTSSYGHVHIDKCWTVGKALAVDLAKRIPLVISDFPNSQTWDYGVNAVGNNRIKNPLMQGGGAGSLPTNWSRSQTATVTVTGNHTPTDGIGKSCRLEVAATSGQEFQLYQTYSPVDGSWYEGGMQLECITTPVNLQAIQLSLLNSGTDYESRSSMVFYSAQASANIEMTAGDILRIKTPPMLFSGRSLSTQQLQLRAWFSGVGTADFGISRAFVQSIDNPYTERS